MKKIILGIVLIAAGLYAIRIILPKLPNQHAFQSFPLTVLFIGSVVIGLALIVKSAIDKRGALADSAERKKRMALLGDMREALGLTRNFNPNSTSFGQISYEFDISMAFFELLKTAQSGNLQAQNKLLQFITRFGHTGPWYAVIEKDEKADLPLYLSDMFYSLQTNHEMRSKIEGIMDIVVYHKRVRYHTSEDIWGNTQHTDNDELPDNFHVRYEYYTLSQYMAKDFKKPVTIQTTS